MGFRILSSLMEQRNKCLSFEPFESRETKRAAAAAACDGKDGFLGVEKKGLPLNLDVEHESNKSSSPL